MKYFKIKKEHQLTWPSFVITNEKDCSVLFSETCIQTCSYDYPLTEDSMKKYEETDKDKCLLAFEDAKIKFNQKIKIS